jgi:polysaccharide biosynthesis transport protein
LSTLRAQLSTAQATYAQSMGYLGPNNPQAKSARAQIDELQKAVNKEQSRLVEQAHQEYVAALANEKQTTAALESEKSDAYKLRDDLVQYTLKQRDFEANRTLYEGLLERIRTAGVQAGLESQEIDIVDQAHPPVSPTLESRSSLLTLYSAIGLVFGIIFAFVLESLDTGLRSIAEIEAVTGLASLALIPRDRKSSADAASQTSLQRSISVLANPKSQFAESFRALRTSLLLSSAGHPPITILLTSATPSEGKTTISTNLACVLAQRDVRVLLIDADLRRPTVHHRFGLNGRIGLTTVLTGASSVEEAIQHVPDVPNLDILASGPVPPFPTEMLGSPTMTALLEKLKTVYTHIVIDSPPLLSVTDGVVLARESDAVVLIVRHGKSSRHVVRRARDLLLRAGAPLTGIALNAVDLNSPEYYGYYGYSGYSYAGVDTTSWKSKSKARKSTEGDRE